MGPLPWVQQSGYELRVVPAIDFIDVSTLRWALGLGPSNQCLGSLPLLIALMLVTLGWALGPGPSSPGLINHDN